LKILTDTGWKLYRANKKVLKKGISITDSFFCSNILHNM
jgi:hypothetical protein